MFVDKMAAFIQLLTMRSKRGGVLHLGDIIPGLGKVCDILKSKYPTAALPHSDALISNDVAPMHPVIFGALDGPVIRAAALQASGAAGASGMDAYSWRRLYSSFKSASAQLCSSISLLARRPCTTFVDPKIVSSLTACRLIALDKNPGVCPIGIGETVWHIIAKAVLTVIGESAAGSLQLCSGRTAGGEAVVHAIRKAYQQDDTEGVLLIDASNAFNSLNSSVALHNIQYLCPQCAPILINTYRDPACLFVDGDVLYSEEGTAQGDPWQCHSMPLLLYH